MTSSGAKELTTLRHRAEARLRATRTDIAGMTTEDIQALVHELQVHQIELELQNEELILAQVELAHSRDRYSDLYDFAPVGYLTLDRLGTILQANLAVATLLGVDRQKLMGRNISDFVDRQMRDACYLHRQAVFAGQHKQVCELAMHTAKDQTLFVRMESIAYQASVDQEEIARTALIDVTATHRAEAKLHLLNQELNQRVADRTAELRQTISGLHREVNTRKAIEAKLREERQFNVNLINTAQAMILVLDLDGRIVMINRYLEKLTGYTLDEIKGKNWIELMVPSSQQKQVHSVFAKAISAKGQTDGNVNLIVAKDGRELNTEWYDAPITDEAGKQTAALCIGLNITERHRLELELRETTENLRAILNATVDAIITIDERGVIVGANASTERMFGYTEKELIGSNVNILMPSPYREEHDEYLRHYLKTAKAHIIGVGREVEGRHKDGSTFPIDLAVSQFHDKTGMMFTGIVRDIRDRKQLERYLADNRIEEQRRLAQELHDGLGGLLTGIGMLAKTLQLKLEGASLSESSQAADIVQHIRDAHEQVRRFSHGLLPVEVASGGLRVALDELAKQTSKNGGLGCQFECIGDVAVHSPVHATHLYRIVQEAVSNAIRHGHATQLVIRLEVIGHRLTLSVGDNGVGIHDSSDSYMGMGLRIMRYRANQIGAQISMQPAESGGTLVVCKYSNEV